MRSYGSSDDCNNAGILTNQIGAVSLDNSMELTDSVGIGAIGGTKPNIFLYVYEIPIDY